MAIPIRPKDLPPGSPLDSAAIPFDTGAVVEKATPLGVVDAAIPLASQAEAEAGLNNIKRVTPLRIKQANTAQVLVPLAAPTGATMSGYKRTTLTAAEYRNLASKSDDRFDFRDMLDADITGNNDMSSTLAAAVAQAGDTTEAALHIPIGILTLDSTVDVPSGVHIVGLGTRPYTSFDDEGSRGPGTWLHIPHAGKGLRFIDGASFPTNNILQGVGFYRDQPEITTGWEPEDYDFDVESVGADLQLIDVVFLNATRAVLQSTGPAGRIMFDRVRGQPALIGIQCDTGYEGLITKDVRWWTHWSNGPDVKAFTLANRRGIYLRHCDNPNISGYFDIYSRYCLFLGSHPNGVPNNVQLVAPEFDGFGEHAIFFESGCDGAHVQANGGYAYGYTGAGTAVDMNGDDCTFVSAALRYQNIKSRAILQSGTGNVARVTTPEVDWAPVNNGLEAFAATPGNKIYIDGLVLGTGTNAAPRVNDIALVSSDEWLTVNGLAVTAQTGTITTSSGSARVRRKNALVTLKGTVTVTTNGTGAGDLRLALPVNVASGQTFYGTGRNVTTGQMVQVTVVSGLATIFTPTNTYPIGSGQTIEFSVEYEGVPL